MTSLGLQSIFDFVKLLFKGIEYVDNGLAFLALNARSRVVVIIYELLNKVSDEQYNQFLENTREEYKKIRIIENILYWFKHDREGRNIDGREDSLKKLYIEMGEEIIRKNINLYDDYYYMDKNIWSLYNIYREDEQKIKKYIKVILNENSIFRFLYDVMGVSHGSDYRYYINENKLRILITEEEIDDILNNVRPSSSDEGFILEVYNSYKNDNKNEWGETGVTLHQEKRLQL